MTDKAIIVPDVHGRRFWREAQEKIESVDKVIFLGDYLDPYPQEGITERQAYLEFKDIIEFKLHYPDKVVLLLGNHDGHYFFDDVDCSRKSLVNAALFHSVFTDNRELFRLAYEETIQGQRYLFTHAGVNPGYLKQMSLPEIYTAENIEKIGFHEMLAVCGRGRSWLTRYEYGSPMWADIYEFLNVGIEEYPNDVIQIFGHTQRRTDPVSVYGKCFCLDVRRCFTLSTKLECPRWDTITT